MTAQMPEKLKYEERQLSMCSEPLRDYFALAGIEPGFESNCTALWRGYVGEWEILNGRLYLIGLSGTLEDGTEANLETIFPGFAHRVFAHWFTGRIRVPQGKMLDYVHMGYASTYERDLFLDIEKGILRDSSVRENGNSAEPNAPEGYGVGAMTFLPRARKDEEV
jgi:hypothetical protein